MRKIIRNAIRCNHCGDVIESTYRHEYVPCSCGQVAVDGGHEVGFVLFFHNFSTFLGRAGIYLEDLFVLPEYRGHGYGKALLQQLARIAIDRGCGRLEWSCLNWNRPSIDFYRSLGARPMDDWTVYRVAGDTLTELARDV